MKLVTVLQLMFVDSHCHSLYLLTAFKYELQLFGIVCLNSSGLRALIMEHIINYNSKVFSIK